VIVLEPTTPPSITLESLNVSCVDVSLYKPEKYKGKITHYLVS